MSLYCETKLLRGHFEELRTYPLVLPLNRAYHNHWQLRRTCSIVANRMPTSIITLVLCPQHIHICCALSLQTTLAVCCCCMLRRGTVLCCVSFLLVAPSKRKSPFALDRNERKNERPKTGYGRCAKAPRSAPHDFCIESSVVDVGRKTRLSAVSAVCVPFVHAIPIGSVGDRRRYRRRCRRCVCTLAHNGKHGIRVLSAALQMCALHVDTHTRSAEFRALLRANVKLVFSLGLKQWCQCACTKSEKSVCAPRAPIGEPTTRAHMVFVVVVRPAALSMWLCRKHTHARAHAFTSEPHGKIACFSGVRTLTRSLLAAVR